MWFECIYYLILLQLAMFKIGGHIKKKEKGQRCEKKGRRGSGVGKSDDPDVPVPGECPGLPLVQRDMGHGN